MYTVISAARISTHSFDKEEVKQGPIPGPRRNAFGHADGGLAELMARTAWPRAVLGARLKEKPIDEGNCPWRLMVSGPLCR